MLVLVLEIHRAWWALCSGNITRKKSQNPFSQSTHLAPPKPNTPISSCPASLKAQPLVPHSLVPAKASIGLLNIVHLLIRFLLSLLLHRLLRLPPSFCLILFKSWRWVWFDGLAVRCSWCCPGRYGFCGSLGNRLCRCLSCCLQGGGVDLTGVVFGSGLSSSSSQLVGVGGGSALIAASLFPVFLLTIF